MISVTAPDMGQTRLESWRRKAAKARDAALSEWRETGATPELNDRIWKELKEILLNDVFHEKCAYCEGKLSAHVPLDVEHYRPRKAVTVGRASLSHSGYFWLAYEWQNLILACRNCNSGHSSRHNGVRRRHPGKANEFPVDGPRMDLPSADPDHWTADLKKEDPLLLHPYFDQPRKHISFDDVGVPIHKDRRGKATIEICHLDRVELVEARIDAQVRCVERLYRLIGDPDRPGTFGPDTPYSAWLNLCMRRRIAELARKCGLRVQEIEELWEA